MVLISNQRGRVGHESDFCCRSNCTSQKQPASVRAHSRSCITGLFYCWCLHRSYEQCRCGEKRASRRSISCGDLPCPPSRSLRPLPSVALIAEPPRRQRREQPLPFVRQDDVARLARLASTRNGPQQRCADSCDHVGYCRRGQPLVFSIALVTAPKYRLSKETGRPTSPLRKKTKENGETCHGYGDDVRHLAGGRT
jgi:hypothetical protein